MSATLVISSCGTPTGGGTSRSRCSSPTAASPQSGGGAGLVGGVADLRRARRYPDRRRARPRSGAACRSPAPSVRSSSPRRLRTCRRCPADTNAVLASSGSLTPTFITTCCRGGQRIRVDELLARFGLAVCRSRKHQQRRSRRRSARSRTARRPAGTTAAAMPCLVSDVADLRDAGRNRSRPPSRPRSRSAHRLPESSGRSGHHARTCPPLSAERLVFRIRDDLLRRSSSPALPPVVVSVIV